MPIFGTVSSANIASPIITGNVNIDSNTLFVDSVNDRIGSGITPTAVFHMTRSRGGIHLYDEWFFDKTPRTAQDLFRIDLGENGNSAAACYVDLVVAHTVRGQDQEMYISRYKLHKNRVQTATVTLVDSTGTNRITTSVASNFQVTFNLTPLTTSGDSFTGYWAVNIIGLGHDGGGVRSVSYTRLI